MDRKRTRFSARFSAIAAILGIGMVSAMVVWGFGCGRTSSEYGQLPPNAETLFLAGIRPPAADTARLLRNAHYLKLMGRPEMALKELEAAYQQDPQNLRVLDVLARAYEELGDFSRAQKLYQVALARDPGNEALNNNLCFSYYLTGQWETAETCFRQALARNPQNIAVRNNLGLLLCRLGRTEEARRLWLEAEGEVAAQKKMQQVMVALGLGETPKYAQRPQPVQVAAAPASASLTPGAVAAKDLAAAKTVVPVSPAPQPQNLAGAPPKIQEPSKLAAKPTPAPVPLQGQNPPAPPKPVAATPATAALTPRSVAVKDLTAAKAAVPVSPAPQPQNLEGAQSKDREPGKPTAAPTPTPVPRQAQNPPAPPKPAAVADKKPTPATTPPPRPPKPKESQMAAAPRPAAPLTATRSTPSGIEVANGSGAPNLARQTRSMLVQEGFQVVSIGNHRDFGAEKTVIYYRAGFEGAARALGGRFFPKAGLEVGGNFSQDADIKILLGKDFVLPEAVAAEPALAAGKIAAGIGPGLPEPKPAEPASAPPRPAVQAQKPGPAPLPVAPAVSAKAADQEKRDKPYLTASELGTMAIEIRNGSGAPNLAHNTRSMLSQEGFQVARIGNHLDFGAEKTIIYYRAGAEKMARNLSARFFPGAQPEQSSRLADDVAVKVILGKDLLQRTDIMARLSN